MLGKSKKKVLKNELDVQKVEIIQGASSAYFGPNAFNGVIKMETKDPFIHTGLTIQSKFGSRNLSETSIRLAEKFQNKKGTDVFAYKINLSYMKAYDWEANNMSAVEGTSADVNNPGGYDAVNRYGDEDTDGDLNDATTNFLLEYKDYPGLGKFYRTGYQEKEIVDYNTNNLKFSSSLHYKLDSNIKLMYKFNYGTGTTVYQGDNRYSLKDIQFFQNIFEIKEDNRFFVRIYRSQEDAGQSYDAVFTAIKLQEHNQITNQDWYSIYKNNWRDNFNWGDVNWNVDGPFYNPLTGEFVYDFNGALIPATDVEYGILMTDSVLNANTENIISSHELTRYQTDLLTNRLLPGTEDFSNALNDITSRISFLEGGTGFYDKSALNHLHAEYQISPKFSEIKFGFNIREYRPDSKGSIFMDTASKISNREYGIYSGIETDLSKNKIKINGTIRLDKNENFNFNFSPAASIIYKNNDHIFRLSFSSAIRNPTLSDQYLYYNVGRAILIGNLSGHGKDYGENLVTIQSLVNYFLPSLEERSKDSLQFFSVNPIRPEKAKSAEIGYRTTLFDKIYVDANYYYSKYIDFIGYKLGVKYQTLQDDTITGAYEISLPSIQVYRMAANAENIVTTKGASIGINYFMTPNITINGNYSWNKLNKAGSEDPIIPAYNTPEHKYNIGISTRDIHLSNNQSFFRDFSFTINYKWVQGFQYEGSPQFTGNVPTYDLVDMQISKKIPKYSTILKLGASNLLNNLHYEVYGGPYIGRMLYASILLELK